MIGVYRFSGTGHAAAVADFLGEQLGVPVTDISELPVGQDGNGANGGGGVSGVLSEHSTAGGSVFAADANRLAGAGSGVWWVR